MSLGNTMATQGPVAMIQSYPIFEKSANGLVAIVRRNTNTWTDPGVQDSINTMKKQLNTLLSIPMASWDTEAIKRDQDIKIITIVDALVSQLSVFHWLTDNLQKQFEGFSRVAELRRIMQNTRLRTIVKLWPQHKVTHQHQFFESADHSQAVTLKQNRLEIYMALIAWMTQYDTHWNPIPDKNLELRRDNMYALFHTLEDDIGQILIDAKLQIHAAEKVQASINERIIWFIGHINRITDLSNNLAKGNLISLLEASVDIIYNTKTPLANTYPQEANIDIDYVIE